MMATNFKVISNFEIVWCKRSWFRGEANGRATTQGELSKSHHSKRSNAGQLVGLFSSRCRAYYINQTSCKDAEASKKCHIIDIGLDAVHSYGKTFTLGIWKLKIVWVFLYIWSWEYYYSQGRSCEKHFDGNHNCTDKWILRLIAIHFLSSK